jgi:hypothetical protein
MLMQQGSIALSSCIHDFTANPKYAFKIRILPVWVNGC